MLKVALIGCGKIADEHVRQLQRIAGSTLVAVYDAEPLMAKQLHERLPGTAYFDDLNRLLSEARPDVVHITTPPHSHHPLAVRCLDAGCHVLIEKPFTMNANEAEDLLARAVRHRLKITVDHNFQFTGPAIRARALIDEGFLGHPLVHLESYYCYDLSDASYAKAFLTDTGHWVRSLPGGLLQNVISHGIGKLAEHLTSDSPVVIAKAFTSPLLKGLGERSVLDELRVMIHDDSTTAYFTFSSQMRPQVFQLRLFGPKNGLFIDENHHLVVKLRGRKYKSYLDNVVPPLELASQFLKSAASNIYGLFSHQLNMNEGMKELIERFHRSIKDDGPVPIPYREILITSRIMDAILLQINQDHQQPGLVGPTVAF